MEDKLWHLFLEQFPLLITYHQAVPGYWLTELSSSLQLRLLWSVVMDQSMLSLEKLNWDVHPKTGTTSRLPRSILNPYTINLQNSVWKSLYKTDWSKINRDWILTMELFIHWIKAPNKLFTALLENRIGRKTLHWLLWNAQHNFVFLTEKCRWEKQEVDEWNALVGKHKTLDQSYVS